MTHNKHNKTVNFQITGVTRCRQEAGHSSAVPTLENKQWKKTLLFQAPRMCERILMYFNEFFSLSSTELACVHRLAGRCDDLVNCWAALHLEQHREWTTVCTQEKKITQSTGMKGDRGHRKIQGRVHLLKDWTQYFTGSIQAAAPRTESRYMLDFFPSQPVFCRCSSEADVDLQLQWLQEGWRTLIILRRTDGTLCDTGGEVD